MNVSDPSRLRLAPRRRFLRGCGRLAAACAGAGLAAGAKAQDAAGAMTAGGQRLALLLGNRDYPAPFDLPPIPKNVHDLRAALEGRGFEVSDGLNLDPARARQLLEAFLQRVRAAPPDAVVFFYFSGHGVQIDAANLLIAAGVDPSARSDTLEKGSLRLLEDVVGRLPERPQGITVAVVDACRTTLKAGSDQDGLNQVEAPPGCLIAFSTGAGRPAIAPAVETINTFYTGSLVKLMNGAAGEVSFSDLFRLVKSDVEKTMSNHPVEAIRKLAQHPFIAENTKRRVSLARSIPGVPMGDHGSAAEGGEAADWQRLEAALWPAEIVQLAQAYLRAYPKGRFSASAQVAHDGAEEAARALQRNDVRLYRGAFQPRPEQDADSKRDLHRAARGDKDAAARLGRQLRQDAAANAGSPNALSRYQGWLQYATALGNGIAAYELALHYRATDQPLPAAQFEGRAKELGYTAPATLDNVRK